MCFVQEISDENYIIDVLNKKCLPRIYKKDPFIFNNQRHFLFDYIKIKEIQESLFEFTFLKFLTLHEKHFAYLILSNLVTTYHLDLMGIGISIPVNKKLRKDYGDTVIERVVFPNPVNIFDFFPGRGPAVLDMPSKLCERIDFLLSGKQQIYPTDYCTAEIKKNSICSLLIK